MSQSDKEKVVEGFDIEALRKSADDLENGKTDMG